MININQSVEDLYLKFWSKPKTHQEWVNSFNTKHQIKEILIRNNKEG